jgi:hypothetical protein
MLRKLAVFAILVTVIATVYGAAATMNLQGGSNQVGIDTNLTCAQDPVKVVAWAINTYGDAGDTEGLDWVTIELSPQDAVNCAGNDLTGRLDITGKPHLYLGCYGDVQADCSYWPSKSVAKISAAKTLYKLAVYDRAFAVKQWPLGEEITGIKLWIGGPANNP